MPKNWKDITGQYKIMIPTEKPLRKVIKKLKRLTNEILLSKPPWRLTLPEQIKLIAANDSQSFTLFLKELISLEVPWNIPILEQIKLLSSHDPQYFAWLIKNKLIDNLSLLLKPTSIGESHVKFSIVMPVFNTDPEILEKAVNSVLRQTYFNWELLICDDASCHTETLKLLELFKHKDSRIKITTNTNNCGISVSTNTCVENATGDFIIFLDHDDEIYFDALSKIKASIDNHPENSLFYSDEDYISPQGARYRYNFKPNFSPFLLETHNYILHLICIRKKLFQLAGGMRKEFDGSQDYDLLLRIMDMNEEFIHIPDVLYSWRESETSMIGGTMKPAIFQAGLKALEEHYKRKGIKVETIKNNIEDIKGVYRTRLMLPEKLDILIIKLGSQDFMFNINELHESINTTIISWNTNEPFPTQISETNADLVLFMDSSLVPVSWSEFIRELAPLVLRKDVGVAGGLVLTEDQKIISAGQTLLPWGEVCNDYHNIYIGNSSLDRRQKDIFAVSGIAMAISSTLLKTVLTKGCLNSDLWDMEICIRAAMHGNNIFTPHAAAITKGLSENFKNDAYINISQLSGKYKIKKSYLNPNLIPRKNMATYDLPPQLPTIPHKNGMTETIDYYNKWLNYHKPDLTKSGQRIDEMKYHPFFSIILPTYNSELKFFKELIKSLTSQTYTNFEICISDDASTDEKFIEYLKNISFETDKIKVSFSEKNSGIAGNTNSAINMAKGDYLVFCDHDDLMEIFALEFIALFINKNPKADVIYSNEDIINQSGDRHSPRLHPDWNPDMLLSHMYCPHIVCFKKEIAQKAGKLNPEMDGAQDYDFFLRATEQAEQVGHIPMILYSWRSVQGSVAMDASAKTYAYDAGKKALEHAMARRGENASVVKASNTGMGVYRVKRKVANYHFSHIIEADSNHFQSLLSSITSLSDYPVEIIIVCKENEQNQLKIPDAYSQAVVITVPNTANRSQSYNAGANIASNDNLIFSSKNMDILDCDYPCAILEHTQRDEIGAVGVKIIYPNGFYYHTGMILGVNGVAGYAHRNLQQFAGYWNFANCIRNYSAVSWDFMGISKKKFNEVNGFDTKLTQFGDVDICLKLIEKGYRNLYTPYVSTVLNRSVHFLEELRNSKEEKIIMQRYGDYIKNDPMHHPLLSKDLEDFSI